MADLTDTTPPFPRRNVTHTNVTVDCGYWNTRLAKRRCELEIELHNNIRKKQLSKGLIRTQSIHLQRKSPYCFYGYQFLDSLKSEMPWLSEEQAGELAEHLFRLKYVVPVMKYVREIGRTTVFYRYAKDERRVAASLRQEKVAFSRLAGKIIHTTSKTLLSADTLVNLLNANMQDWARDMEITDTQDLRPTTLCQKLLLHGFLIPVQEEPAPERFQKFRWDVSYYLCNCDIGRDLAFQRIDDIRKESRDRETTNTNTTSTLRRQLSMRGSKSNQNTVTRQTGLRRSKSLRTRKKNKTAVYWTVKVGADGEQENTRVIMAMDSVHSPLDTILGQSSIIAEDVEVLHLYQARKTYEPPIRRTSLSKKMKVVLKTLCGVRRNSVGRPRVGTISSIDAEWSVY